MSIKKMALNFAKYPQRHYVKEVTPIEFLPRFSAALGGPKIYIKRDDLLPGAGGGNKTRKLDFSIGDALAKGADTLITCGAIQSNHCRLTLSAAAKEGLACHLILEERVPGTYDPNATGNNFLFKLLGAKSITVVPKGANMGQEMQSAADKLKANGANTYIIPGGASNETGALGYAKCGQEVFQQLRDLKLDIQEIIVPSGSAGTHAGFITGLRANNCQIPIRGICVNKPKDVEESMVHGLAEKLVKYMNIGPDTVPRDHIVCIDTQVGPGYSQPTNEMIEAVTLLARTEGILLDPVYSGKTMAGLIELVRNGQYKKDQNLLFLHTGGSPALFAYVDVFNPHIEIPVTNSLKN